MNKLDWMLKSHKEKNYGKKRKAAGRTKGFGFEIDRFCRVNIWKNFPI